MKKRKNLHTGYVLFSYMSQKVEKHFILNYYLLYIIIIFSVDFLTFLWKPLTTRRQTSFEESVFNLLTNQQKNGIIFM